jgi:HEAT repeat protein
MTGKKAMIENEPVRLPLNMPFKDVLIALLDDERPFPARFLHRFSDLPSVDLNALKKTWLKVSSMRKHTLLEDLEDLAETDTLTSFDDMARSLLADPDAEVRTRAIRLLWEAEDLRLVPVYLKMLREDENAEVRAAAANALGQFVYLGELEKIPPEMKKQIEDQLLITTTTAKESLVRRRALESMGYSGRKEVSPLIEAAYQEKKPEWISSALFAMGRSCDDRWKKQVLSQLRSPNDDVRSEAIHAVGELELRAARPTLLDQINDEEDIEIRRELILALSKIGGEGVRTKLEELLEIEEDDEEVEFIEEALNALTFTEDSGPFDLIDVDPDTDFIEEEANDDE